MGTTKRFTVKVEVTAVVWELFLFLESKRIYPAYDGDETYRSTEILDILDDKLDVTMRVVGVNNTAWKIKLAITKSDDEKFGQITYEKSGRIKKNQTHLHKAEISLKPKEAKKK